MGFNDYNFDNGEQAVVADFSDDLTRKNFTKKVLGLLGVMLSMCFGLILTVKVLHTNGVVTAGVGLFSYGALIFSTVMYFSMLLTAVCCCRPLLRKVPINFIFLFTWTLFFSHVISFVGLTYDIQTITSAMGGTAAITVMVSLLVAFTNFDFSKLLPIIGAVLMAWVLTLFICMIVGFQFNRFVYAGIGTTIFTIYLAVDLKMMVGGGRYQYSEDEYVLAAINIFLDIINIFMYMLQFMRSD